ncbi:Release factor glutamine methyltransferase [secondary endosymbiont of Trabutina mannipara]|uniref:Release factor glutamine methyltransferase n=1 Tax=secondary endosymbiont of Trabutina mannipara TaxID=1835721 RepID=A0A1C3L3S5_9ENTR|nr:peptide chain release factor N(5)-glutamine methyltransferase [secondary endosymbiont of Trabutina mannipara]SBT81940.1 Release factor glutamine methyltransferase [secondary endosymbiont of Trabutina mannipara]
MNWQQWLTQAKKRLLISESPSAKRDAEILLSQVTGANRTKILAFGETLLTDAQNKKLNLLLERRERGEPIAYLTGEREFWSLKLRVTTDTLIPRADTECLVQCTLDIMSPICGAKVLDLGTGSGAIALAIAFERPAWYITGVDRIPSAVSIAQENAKILGINNVHFQESYWFQSVNIHNYNIVVSNPPYIYKNDPYLTQGDVRFEPKSSLVSGKNGFQDLEIICRESIKHLIPGGWLILEHGWRQGAYVRTLLANFGFSRIVTIRDYGDNDRVSKGQKL